ncbi:MAG: T9SS type A sorting domain-containing protein [Saprospiraceae bacterium]|nr:T9SS type A sorting domain-containing protein [Saprospiraceae bacterium]
MRYTLTFIITIAFIGLVSAQSTFNKRINFGFPAQLITNVEVDSLGIYCIGVLGDSFPPYPYGSLFARFNMEGDLTHFHYLSSVEKGYSFFDPNLKWTLDGHLKCAGYYRSPDILYGTFIKYSKEGILLDTMTFGQISYLPKSSHKIINWIELNENSEIIITEFKNSNTNLGQVGIIKRVNGVVTEERNVGHKYGILNKSKLEYAENKILLGNLVLGPILGDNIKRVNITAVDTSLIIASTVWESHPDSIWSWPVDMIKAPDGGVIVAFKRGKYILAAQEINYVPSVFKLKADFSGVDWVSDVPTYKYSALNETHKLLSDTLNNCFYVCGEDYHLDTIVVGASWRGFLAKFKFSGEYEWTRNYLIIDTKFDWHQLFDMKRTSDGGFVLVGQAIDMTSETPDPSQQAWLLKVDSFGCLVPGCQIVSPVQDVAPTSLDVRLYPNPVRDGQTAIYIGEQALGDAMVTFIDLQGRLLKSWPIHHQEPTTYLLDLPPVSTGMYILQVQAGQLMWTERVIVE